MQKQGKLLWLVPVLSLSFTWAEDPATLVKKHLEQGTAYLKTNQPREAEPEFRRVIELDPENAQAYNLLGLVYDQLGDHEKADASFQEAIRLAPAFTGSYNNLGISYLRQNRTAEAQGAFLKVLELDPRDATAHYNLGLLYMKEGDFQKSVDHLEQARSLKPGDPAILFNLAKGHFQMGSYSNALAILQDLDRLPASSRLPEVQNLLGTVLTRSGQLDPAIVHLQKAADLDPAGSDPHYKLALAWQKKGNLDEALEEIRKAISLQAPAIAEQYLALGMIHRQRGENEEAIRALRKTFALAPEAESTRFALAVLLRDAGHYQEAAREFERARAAHRSYDLDFNLATTYYLVGDFPRALSLLEEISAADNRSKPASFYQLLASVYGKMERWSEALGTLENAIELNPRTPALYFDLGLVLVNLNALNQAEQFFLGVLKHFPDSAEFYVGLAQARMLQDHYQKALEDLHVAIRLNPSYAEAHYLTGNCFNETNRYAEARQAYEKAIALSPNRADFHFSLGSLLEKQGENGPALSEFEKALALNPASADAHYRLARLYSEQGNIDRAVEHLREAIELNPRDPQSYGQLASIYFKAGRREEAQQALETLQALKKTGSTAATSPLSSVKLKPVEQYLRLLNP